MSISPHDTPALVEPQPWMLAYNEEVGSIFRCHQCRNVHLTLGPANIQVTPQTFLAVVDLFQRAASNFELMLDAERDSHSCE